jgi:hypothetical protein
MIARPRIRQLGLGELLDETFRLYRNHFLDFIAMAALVMVPYTLLNYLLQLPFQQQLAWLQNPANQLDPLAGQSTAAFFSSLMFGVLGSILLSLLYIVVFQPILEGALAHAISRRYLDQPSGIRDSFGAAIRRALSLIGARLIPTLAGMFAGLLIFGVLIGGMAALFGMRLDGTDGGGAIVLIGILLTFGLFVLLGLAAIFFAVRILFTSQAVMVEDRGAIDAIRRSWRLTQGFFWRTLGFLIVIYLIVFFITAIPAALLTLPATMLLQDQPELLLLINTVVNAVLQVVVLPFSMIAYTLIYFDLRVRKEGFDLEQQAGALLGDHGLPAYPQRY